MLVMGQGYEIAQASFLNVREGPGTQLLHRRRRRSAGPIRHQLLVQFTLEG